jgi:hypothetical protein
LLTSGRAGQLHQAHMQIAAGVQGDRGVVSAQHGCRICCEHILLDMQGMQMMTLLRA